jgi:hypothetical protein
LQNFVIIGSPRTGSNYLISLLNNINNLTCYYEIYHPEKIFCPLLLQKLKINNFIDEKKLINLRNNDPLFFLKKYIYNSSNSLIGFKIFNNHNHLVLDYLKRSKNIKKIILIRSNFLAVYSSELIAQKNNIWWTDNPIEQKTQILFDKNHYEKRLEEYNMFYCDIISELKKTNQNFLILFYQKWDKKIFDLQLFPFLGIKENNVNFNTNSKKINSQNIIERFLNKEDVLNYLKKNNLEHWKYENIN